MNQKVIICLALLFFSQIVIAQVHLYYEHHKQYEPAVPLQGVLWVNVGVNIDGILDTKIYDDTGELVTHYQTDVHTFTSGRNVIHPGLYEKAPLLNTRKNGPIINEKIVTELIHPLDKTSIIARMEIDGKHYGKLNGYLPRRDRNFYVVPDGMAITSRASDYHKEGIRLKHAVRLAKKYRKDLTYNNFKLDLNASKLWAIYEDGTGRELMSQDLLLQQERYQYVKEEAYNNNRFFSNQNLVSFDQDFMQDREELITFNANAYYIPYMTKMITTEGNLVFYETGTEIIDTTLEIELRDGAISTINDTKIRWEIKGGGSCGKASYELLHANTGLKIKNIKLQEPVFTACDHSSSFDMDYVAVDRAKLPHKTLVTISYYKTNRYNEYFQTHFTLPLDGQKVPIQKDDHDVSAEIFAIRLDKTPKKDKYAIEIDLKKPEGNPGINTKRSKVTFRDMNGIQFQVGNVNIKDNYFMSLDDHITVRTTKLPNDLPHVFYLDTKLVTENFTEEVEEFEIHVKNGKILADAVRELYGYSLSVLDHPSQNENEKLQYIGVQEEGYCCNIPGIELEQIIIRNLEGRILLREKEGMFYDSEAIPDEYYITLVAKKKKQSVSNKMYKVCLGCVASTTSSLANKNVDVYKPKVKSVFMEKDVVPIDSLKGKLEKFVDQIPILSECDTTDARSARKCSNDKLLNTIKAFMTDDLTTFFQVSPKSAMLKFIIDIDGSIHQVETSPVTLNLNTLNKLSKVLESWNQEQNWIPAQKADLSVAYQFNLPWYKILE